MALLKLVFKFLTSSSWVTRLVVFPIDMSLVGYALYGSRELFYNQV